MIQPLSTMKSYEEVRKPIATNFNEKKVTCKMQYFYILLAFLLITILLIIATIYCDFIKCQTKHLLPFHGIKN